MARSSALLFFIFIIFNLHTWAAGSYQLTVDQELAHLGLNPEVVQFSPVADPDSKQDPFAAKRSDLPLINLKFGQLSPQQFQGLMDFYRNKSFISYDPEKNYYLTDFLTPQMQALTGMDFDTRKTKIEVQGFTEFMFGEEIPSDRTLLSKSSALSTAQCWGTAWNTLVSLQAEGKNRVTPYEVAFVNPEVVTMNLLSDKYSSLVNKGEQLRYGDLLGMVAVNKASEATPVHFAVYIGFGLVFEKEDALKGNPYRIVSAKDTYADLVKAVQEHVSHQGDHVELTVRRFLDQPKDKLPKLSLASGSRFLDEETYKYFGRTAARLRLNSEQTMGGGTRPYLEKITVVRFDVNPNTRKGEVSPAAKKYFSEAYHLMPALSCKALF